jgi:hypothetical protein
VAKATFVAVGLMLAVAVLLVWACVGRRRLIKKRLKSQLALILSCMASGYWIGEKIPIDRNVPSSDPRRDGRPM